MRTLFALAIVASPALAADLVVAPGQSIQAAIAAAQPGDRVLVQPGTYFESLDLLGKPIELVGLGGAGATVVDATGRFGAVVTMHSGEGPDTVLRGLTFTGGQLFGTPEAGGGVSAWTFAGGPTGPTLVDCAIVGNQAFWAGGGVAGEFLQEQRRRDRPGERTAGNVIHIGNLRRKHRFVIPP